MHALIIFPILTCFKVTDTDRTLRSEVLFVMILSGLPNEESINKWFDEYAYVTICYGER